MKIKRQRNVTRKADPGHFFIVTANQRAQVEVFRRAATKFNAGANNTPRSALNTLVSEGIVTKKGNVAKNYK